MKPIDHYTTLSEKAIFQIDRLPTKSKIHLMMQIIHTLNKGDDWVNISISSEVYVELLGLNPNKLLGLIKGLADQCQLTLISH
jgi:hypothetical protein